MALQGVTSPAARIGKIKGEILTHAIAREVLGLIGNTKPMPANQGDTVVFRRWLPKNATAASPNTLFANGTGDRGAAYANGYLAGEGSTPDAETLVPQDITCTMNEYVVLFGYTKRAADMYEDDIPGEMKKHCGERLSLVREMVRFGVAKGCTNKFYGGTGTTRATVNGPLTLSLLRKITKGLDLQHTDKVTEVLSASQDYGTTAVEASFFIFIHTDLKPDVRDMDGFVPVAKYGSYKPVSPYEFGSVEEYRFIASPELISVQDSGAAIGTTGLYSTTGANIDTYQVIVAGPDAWGDVALRGVKAMDLHDVPPGQKDKNDPTGARGYIGASNYFTAVLLNSFHMAVAEVGATAI